MEPIITVRNLAKRYELGKPVHRTLGEMLSHRAQALMGLFRSRPQGADESEFWALQDLSFTLGKGEVVGIIGRNGAGKSTLLKLLSRITEPTLGSIRLQGRISSLLEVGTGFHPELSGRDNIYLNGSILGMTRAEIDARFDEIVSFAGVERFLDTPVKHYSSGMYVRLAFAVAAHLETEILIIDEVLAVGDSRFQEKCLGKMNDIASSGRTVLFVSHNMDAVLRLCQRVLWLDEGRLLMDGPVSEVVAKYLSDRRTQPGLVALGERPRPAWLRQGGSRFKAMHWLDEAKRPWVFEYGQAQDFAVSFSNPRRMERTECFYAVFSAMGTEVGSSTSRGTPTLQLNDPGEHRLRITIEDLRLVPGVYHLSLCLKSAEGTEDFLVHVVDFEVTPNEASARDGVGELRSLVVPTTRYEALTPPS